MNSVISTACVASQLFQSLRGLFYVVLNPLLKQLNHVKHIYASFEKKEVFDPVWNILYTAFEFLATTLSL